MLEVGGVTQTSPFPAYPRVATTPTIPEISAYPVMTISGAELASWLMPWTLTGLELLCDADAIVWPRVYWYPCQTQSPQWTEFLNLFHLRAFGL